MKPVFERIFYQVTYVSTICRFSHSTVCYQVSVFCLKYFLKLRTLTRKQKMMCQDDTFPDFQKSKKQIFFIKICGTRHFIVLGAMKTHLLHTVDRKPHNRNTVNYPFKSRFFSSTAGVHILRALLIR
jgi:hypothetical protein